MSEITFTFSKNGNPVDAPQKGIYYVATVPPGTDKKAAQKQLRKLHPGSFFAIRVVDIKKSEISDLKSQTK